ncbi:hypothetical protein, partial [Xanthomonas perforans]|uniref:hypothetical protein n=1 Tax=Xanthomonas perforans TaxID=442694 RepID=UPI0019D2A0F0
MSDIACHAHERSLLCGRRCRWHVQQSRRLMVLDRHKKTAICHASASGFTAIRGRPHHRQP